ncbi:TetR/AcrR family transcriptional regulator [Ktedonosporobacter rubrisoli]|nr:TetR/AcrR family transcriptional regulator [Ktedonosporobacter rubrisoli]
MARPKTFDRTQMLDKAIELFWNRGYEATSIHDLLAHLGIRRQSLYDTFGDKHTLFLEALRRYEARNIASTVDVLEGPGSGKAAIEAVFRSTVQTLACTEPPRGCMIVNTAIELAPHDEEIARCVSASVTRTQQAFYHALVRAQEHDEIHPQLDLLALARFLTSSLQGLNITAKAVRDARQLQEIANVALSLLA